MWKSSFFSKVAFRLQLYLKMNSFTGIFKDFAKIISYPYLHFGNLGTAIFKEHLSVVASESYKELIGTNELMN